MTNAITFQRQSESNQSSLAEPSPALSISQGATVDVALALISQVKGQTKCTVAAIFLSLGNRTTKWPSLRQQHVNTPNTMTTTFCGRSETA